jgi:rhomboid protease GluP
MAFGFKPKHVEEITFENLTQEQILIIGLETAKKLNWRVGATSEGGFVAYTSMSMSSWGEQLSVAIENNRAIVTSECTGSQIADWGKNKRNVQTFLETLNQQREVLSGEEIASRHLELKSTFHTNESAVNQPLESSRGKITGVLSIFTPTDGYFITPIIVILNILVFVLMVVGGANAFLPDSESLLQWGANFRPMTLDGQWWRLLTSCFLHIGILHLAMNLYALVYIGIMLEPRLGKTRFLAAYIISGIGGSVASLFWHELTISAGASGAIFGMYGVFLAMLTTNLIEKAARQTLLTSVAIFVGYNLVNGLRGGIDNAAHIGGLITGMIFGYCFYLSLTKPEDTNRRYLTIVLPAILVLGASIFVFTQTSNDVGEYQKKMDAFVVLEAKALEVFSKLENTPNDEILKEIEEKGIASWKEGMKLINETEKLNIPEELREKNKKLLEYCQLRVESYELLYKAIKEDTDQYASEMTEYNRRLEDVIKQLGGGEQ